MKLPYGASENDFEKCKIIVAKLIADDENFEPFILGGIILDHVIIL